MTTKRQLAGRIFEALNAKGAGLGVTLIEAIESAIPDPEAASNQELVELLENVQEMRTAQKAFFRSKHTSHIIRAKAYESKVDKQAAKMLAELKHGKQGDLFK